MKTASLPRIIALAIGTLVGAATADAQTPVCPPGYFYASDGQCYPSASQPVYPLPVYAVAPPVYQPPVVFDGFSLGIGFGGRIGSERGGRAGHGGGGRGNGERGDGGRGDGGRGGGEPGHR